MCPGFFQSKTSLRSGHLTVLHDSNTGGMANGSFHGKLLSVDETPGRNQMVEIQIAYEGKLRCTATHGPSGNTLFTDAPKDNMGEGKSFSPTDLVATALGTCMLTIMGIYSQRIGLDLTGTTVKVTKEMVTAPVRRIGKLSVEFTVPVPTTEEQQIKLREAALQCPVHKSLHPDVEKPVTFKWAK
jgi:putative redox protein